MSIIDDEEELKDYGLIENDGVNVAACKYFNNGWCLLSESCNDIKYLLCGDMTLQDCYFKQLQRLKKENEKYKQALEEIREIIDAGWCREYDGNGNLCQDCTKENECGYFKIYEKINEVLADVET